MTKTIALVSGRSYRVHLHARAEYATAGFNGIQLDYDGASIGHFDLLTTTVANQEKMCDAEVTFTASADDASAVFTVENAGAGAGNLTLKAGSDHPRTLSIYDNGPGV
jgi:hypothetical protein